MKCDKCNKPITPPGRQELGYTTCLKCGEVRAKEVRHCTAPINKSNYMYIRNPELLKQLNPKRTT